MEGERVTSGSYRCSPCQGWDLDLQPGAAPPRYIAPSARPTRTQGPRAWGATAGVPLRRVTLHSKHQSARDAHGHKKRACHTLCVGRHGTMEPRRMRMRMRMRMGRRRGAGGGQAQVKSTLVVWPRNASCVLKTRPEDGNRAYHRIASTSQHVTSMDSK